MPFLEVSEEVLYDEDEDKASSILEVGGLEEDIVLLTIRW